MLRLFLGFAPLLITASIAGPAFAAEQKFTATLNGDSEVPQVQTDGTGSAELVFDPSTKKLTWTITFDDLSEAPIAAHFHGPAAAGSNAAVVIKIDDLQSPSEGNATLSADQETDLTAGLWYINYHTNNHPDGEIRGQVVKAQ